MAGVTVFTPVELRDGYTCDVCCAAVSADARRSHACAELVNDLLQMTGGRVSCAELLKATRAVVQAERVSCRLADFVLNRVAAARALDRVVGGHEALALAMTCYDIGLANETQRKYDEALTWFHEARAIFEEKAPNSLDLAGTYSNIGLANKSQCKYDEALTWFNKARVIFEEKAPNSLDLAGTYYDIGLANRSQCKYDEALTWFNKARVIFEEKAPNSLDLARTYSNIGLANMSQCKYDEALTWFHKARAIFEEMTPNSLDLAETLVQARARCLCRAACSSA